MKISVALASFNGAKYIEEQLISIAAQTVLPDELVICDDSSSDNTVEIIEKFIKVAPFKIILLINDSNLGYAKNFEKSLMSCSGDLIFLSDQDDVWYEDKILTFCSVINNNNVLICDALYTDLNRKNNGTTVLGKILKFSHNKNHHIAGACTAITKEFRNFIFPMPEYNFPAHDVYIHRWANLLNTKIVIQDILQEWRIHNNNNSVSEMNNDRNIQNFDLYKKYKNIDSSLSYIVKANEFNEMLIIIEQRYKQINTFINHINIDKVKIEINNTIEANLRRSKISGNNFTNKIKIIILLLIYRQYKYFHGWKSFFKDVLR